MRSVYIAVVLVLAGWTAAAAKPHVAMVKFSGASTLHNFEGAGVSEPFEITVVRGASNETPRMTAEATLQVSALSTAHKARDKNMMKVFEQAIFPSIRGQLRAAPLAQTGEKLSVPLELAMHGKTNTIKAELSEVMQNADDEVSFHINFDVNLDAFGMKPPSVLGLIRVDNLIKVDCRIQPYTPPR